MTCASLVLPFVFLLQIGATTPYSFCGEHDTVVEKLDETYEEKPDSIGLGGDGAVIEVYSSKDGSFTILITHPTGLTCVLVAGEYWERFPAIKGQHI